MKRNRKSVSLANLHDTFPTLTKFENSVFPYSRTKQEASRTIFWKPHLPEYLKDLKSDGNPFTAIKKKSTKELMGLEKERKIFERKKMTDYPIEETVNRHIRIKYNASYKTNEITYAMNTKEMLLQRGQSENKVTLPKIKNVTNFEFIEDKRKLCFLELAINEQKKLVSRLDNIIENEEQFIKDETNRLLKEKKKEDSKLKKTCLKTSSIVLILEGEILQNKRKAEKLRKVTYTKNQLESQCLELEGEFQKLNTYGHFLANCYKQYENKQTLEKTMVANDFKLETILNELKVESKVANIDSVGKTSSHFVSNVTDLEGAGELNVSNVNEKMTISTQSEKESLVVSAIEPATKFLNKQQLSEMKKSIFVGFDNASNKVNPISEFDDISSPNDFDSDANPDDFSVVSIVDSSCSRHDTFFSNPIEIVNLITELEINNLCLIENVQEQEEMCEKMRKRSQTIKHDMQYQIEQIDLLILTEKENIQELNESIKFVADTEHYLTNLCDTQRYREVFCVTGMDISSQDQMISFLQEKIGKLFNAVFDIEIPSNVDSIEMLRKLESLIDTLYIKLRSHDSDEIVKAKKVFDETKLLTARIRKIDLMKKMEQLKLQKAINRVTEHSKSNRGRKVVYRSNPENKVAIVEKSKTKEIRNEEEFAYFFT